MGTLYPVGVTWPRGFGREFKSLYTSISLLLCMGLLGPLPALQMVQVWGEKGSKEAATPSASSLSPIPLSHCPIAPFPATIPVCLPCFWRVPQCTVWKTLVYTYRKIVILRIVLNDKRLWRGIYMPQEWGCSRPSTLLIIRIYVQCFILSNYSIKRNIQSP